MRHIQPGTYTALVTPFTTQGDLDKAAFIKLIQHQINSKITGLVPCGTTGESVTLTHQERQWIIQATVEHAQGKALVLAGTGSNSTAQTIAYTKEAEQLGANGALIVTPYYNKPTQEGLYQHYKKISEHTKLPIILYNVPGRTGCDLQADTVVRLARDCANIVGIKEAAGLVDRVAELKTRCPDSFLIFSGDDGLALPMITVGAQGLISVASNVVPTKVVQLVNNALKGHLEEAKTQHLQLRALFFALFVESNPIPVKKAMSLLGLIEDTVRLPLWQANDKTTLLIQDALKKLH